MDASIILRGKVVAINSMFLLKAITFAYIRVYGKDRDMEKRAEILTTLNIVEKNVETIYKGTTPPIPIELQKLFEVASFSMNDKVHSAFCNYFKPNSSSVGSNPDNHLLNFKKGDHLYQISKLSIVNLLMKINSKYNNNKYPMYLLKNSIYKLKNRKLFNGNELFSYIINSIQKDNVDGETISDFLHNINRLYHLSNDDFTGFILSHAQMKDRYTELVDISSNDNFIYYWKMLVRSGVYVFNLPDDIIARVGELLDVGAELATRRVAYSYFLTNIFCVSLPYALNSSHDGSLTMVKACGVVTEPIEYAYLRGAIRMSDGSYESIRDNLEFIRTSSLTPAMQAFENCSGMVRSNYSVVACDDYASIQRDISFSTVSTRWSGAVSVDLSSVRSSSNIVAGGIRLSSGVLPYVRILDEIVMSQGRLRGCANSFPVTVYLNLHHQDILELLESVRRHDLKNIQLGILVDDLFFRSLTAVKDYYLINPTVLSDLKQYLLVAQKEHVQNAAGGDLSSFDDIITDGFVYESAVKIINDQVNGKPTPYQGENQGKNEFVIKKSQYKRVSPNTLLDKIVSIRKKANITLKFTGSARAKCISSNSDAKEYNLFYYPSCTLVDRERTTKTDNHGDKNTHLPKNTYLPIYELSFNAKNLIHYKGPGTLSFDKEKATKQLEILLQWMLRLKEQYSGQGAEDVNFIVHLSGVGQKMFECAKEEYGQQVQGEIKDKVQDNKQDNTQGNVGVNNDLVSHISHVSHFRELVTQAIELCVYSLEEIYQKLSHDPIYSGLSQLNQLQVFYDGAVVCQSMNKSRAGVNVFKPVGDKLEGKRNNAFSNFINVSQTIYEAFSQDVPTHYGAFIKKQQFMSSDSTMGLYSKEISNEANSINMAYEDPVFVRAQVMKMSELSLLVRNGMPIYFSKELDGYRMSALIQLAYTYGISDVFI